MNRNFYLKTQKENQNNHTEKSNSYFRPRQPSLTQKKVQVNCREAAIKHTSSLCLYGVVKIGGLLYWLTWSMKGGPWTNSISVLMDLVHSTLPGTSLVWCPTHFLPSVFYPFPDTNLILYLSVYLGFLIKYKFFFTISQSLLTYLLPITPMWHIGQQQSLSNAAYL